MILLIHIRLEQGKSAVTLRSTRKRSRAVKDNLVKSTLALYQEDDQDSEWEDLNEDVDENIQRDFDIINGDILEEDTAPPESGIACILSTMTTNLEPMLWFRVMVQWRKAIYHVFRKDRTMSRARRMDQSLWPPRVWSIVPLSRVLVRLLHTNYHILY